MTFKGSSLLIAGPGQCWYINQLCFGLQTGKVIGLNNPSLNPNINEC